MRRRTSVLEQSDKAKKKLLQWPASLEMRRNPWQASQAFYNADQMTLQVVPPIQHRAGSNYRTHAAVINVCSLAHFSQETVRLESAEEIALSAGDSLRVEIS